MAHFKKETLTRGPSINKISREVVVAQLVERSLSIPEIRGSTQVIRKILLNIYLLSTVLKRRK